MNRLHTEKSFWEEMGRWRVALDKIRPPRNLAELFAACGEVAWQLSKLTQEILHRAKMGAVLHELKAIAEEDCSSIAERCNAVFPTPKEVANFKPPFGDYVPQFADYMQQALMGTAELFGLLSECRKILADFFQEKELALQREREEISRELNLRTKDRLSSPSDIVGIELEILTERNMQESWHKTCPHETELERFSHMCAELADKWDDFAMTMKAQLASLRAERAERGRQKARKAIQNADKDQNFLKRFGGKTTKKNRTRAKVEAAKIWKQEGMTIKDIASRLDMSPDGVKSMLKRSKKKEMP